MLLGFTPRGCVESHLGASGQVWQVVGTVLMGTSPASWRVGKELLRANLQRHPCTHRALAMGRTWCHFNVVAGDSRKTKHYHLPSPPWVPSRSQFVRVAIAKHPKWNGLNNRRAFTRGPGGPRWRCVSFCYCEGHLPRASPLAVCCGLWCSLTCKCLPPTSALTVTCCASCVCVCAQTLHLPEGGGHVGPGPALLLRPYPH